MARGDRAARCPLARRAAARRGFAGHDWLSPACAALVAPVRGRVVGFGAGTTATLRHYGPPRCLVVVEPDPGVGVEIDHEASALRLPVTVLAARPERLPLPSDAFDVVVSALALCSVADQAAALAEARRVLAPWGRLVFLEHIRSVGLPGRLQDLAAPLWSRLAGGCRPDRRTLPAITAAGFQITELEIVDARGRSLAAPVVRGVATPPDQRFAREARWLRGERT
ncbi:Methyltransferase domain-containing protein [Streptoalloteichus tenebrarius]|uniref:Methyltransferase domain-containing protein n=1 Tax=Streptoalloteichus tenebrarius (strain ATCC 17920 / DSM 40477 / JCM 4838 / CBS 697.72 / NBRC 16177 / NCIMB 11028 / NRRL B-12390 / A12253. 1 / ISP 5477) TaxID=1933 RepID=A0ABT1I432_STRSD|nr:methyltransferase domain-containing protein [Streptoalloteichus tenebrarius]MCP2262561.1 Methyltransferase domain-containing protein [Streptoalloteichus tenebrarius]BFF00751.1 hypothetical protein GCM10020241_24260 [Streptoalloteichus tenebrarius]